MAIRDKERFRRTCEHWLAEEPTLFRRIGDFALHHWYKVKRTGYRDTFLHEHFLLILTAASVPAGFLAAEKITIYQCVVIVGVLWLALALTRRQRAKPRLSDRMQQLWVLIGDLLNTVKSDATRAGDKDESISTTLSLMANLAAEVAQVDVRQVAATLVTYQGTGYGKMKVVNRDRWTQRPKGRPVKDLSTLLGHIACQREAKPRVVPDLERFGPLGRKSPTQTTASYRSIFIHPVVSSRDKSLRGFISIDCTVPHAFHGDRAEHFVALVEPLKAHVEDMI